MRRRDFIKVIAGSATSWPLVARAQQERVRRVGVLIGTGENDPETRRRVDALIAGQWCGDVTDYVFTPDTLTVKFHDSRPANASERLEKLDAGTKGLEKLDARTKR
jgi:hypothetical protein